MPARTSWTTRVQATSRRLEHLARTRPGLYPVDCADDFLRLARHNSDTPRPDVQKTARLLEEALRDPAIVHTWANRLSSSTRRPRLR